MMYSSITTDIQTLHPTLNSQQGRSLLAISGAMIWPGVGHFLVGSYYMGFFWFTLAIASALGIVSILVTPEWIPALGWLVPFALLVCILQIPDALRAARKPNCDLLREPSLRFLAAVVLMIGGILRQHRAIRYLQNNVFEICYTPTPSMAPLLMEGDRFITLKSIPIRRWDIAGFSGPDAFAGRINFNVMKRVVGMPGDKVEITAKGVLINGKLIDLPAEAGPYMSVDHWTQPLVGPSPQTAANGCWGKPITLGSDEYYLLGDNSEESFDARFWPSVHGHQPGAMPRDQITCKVVAICWPPSRWRMFR